jgi:NAD(P)-dependent dehydrogenase (short-subunit alcohol dehydrogenase family)
MDKRRIIVITGATRGLGHALAEEFIRLGCTVAGCGRTRETIEDWRRRTGPPHQFEAVNVASDEQVRDWAERVLETVGPPDLLLNNAGVINANDPLWRISAPEFSWVIDVNVKGVANMIRHLVPAMVARRKGVIVNFSSGWGRSTDAEVAPYCASKWAIEGLTQALAQELPAGMAAIPLNPGIINTEMLQSCFGSSAANYPSAQAWAKETAPFLLRLGPKDNGRPLTAPG